MNTLFKLFALLFIITNTTHSFAQADTSAIRQSFDNLKMALLEQDGQKVLGLIDKNTFAFYSGILVKAKTYDSIRVENLQLVEKILVFTARLEDEQEHIKSMDDAAFFQYLIRRGMIDRFGFSIGGFNLGSISIAGDSAQGQLVLATTPLPYKVTFHLESNKWKVDLSSLIPVSNLALKHMVVTKKQTDTDFLVSLIKEQRGLNDVRILWKPLNK